MAGKRGGLLGEAEGESKKRKLAEHKKNERRTLCHAAPNGGKENLLSLSL